MQVEPQDALMLPANSLHELHVGIRPMSASPCSQLMYINVVDVELHQVQRPLFLDITSIHFTFFRFIHTGFLQVRENWKSRGKVRGKYFLGKIREKSGKVKNWCHEMSDFQAKMHQI